MFGWDKDPQLHLQNTSGTLKWRNNKLSSQLQYAGVLLHGELHGRQEDGLVNHLRLRLLQVRRLLLWLLRTLQPLRLLTLWALLSLAPGKLGWPAARRQGPRPASSGNAHMLYMPGA